MKLRVLELPVAALARIFAITAAILSIPIAAILILGALMLGPEQGGGTGAVALYLFVPLIYLVVTYLSAALFLWLFNRIAASAGGIELEVAMEPPPATPPTAPPAPEPGPLS